MIRKAIVLTVLLLIIIACNPQNQPGGEIDVDVGAGTTPAYYWDGGVCSLTVARTSNLNRIVWGVTSGSKNNITSPYFQGEVKTGLTRIANVESVLTDGVEYRVRVVRTDGAEGWNDFIPSM
ncbi:MAG: hypothetical protein ABIL05_01150 [candidate division WOR-3 bacterium]